MKISYFHYLLLVFIMVSTNVLLAQNRISDDEIIENISPYVGSFNTYDLIHSSNKAHYVLLSHKKDKGDDYQAFLCVIHDIGIEDDFMDMDVMYGLSYKVSDNYIKALEDTVLPKIAKELPNVNKIKMYHLVKGEKLEDFNSLPNHTNYKKYTPPLTVILERRYKTGVVDLYTEGIGHWKHESYGGCLLEFNSRNFKEAQEKFYKISKSGIKPNWSKSRDEYEAALSMDKKKWEEVEKARIKDFFFKNNYSYKNDKFWANLEGNYNIIKTVYEGDFNRLKRSKLLNHLFKVFIIHLSENCTSLLPSKTVNFYKTFTSGGNSSYSHTLYMGGNEYIDVYNPPTEIKIVEVSIDMDPKYESYFLEFDKNPLISASLITFFKNKEKYKSYLTVMKANIDFFSKTECDNRTLYMLGENLYRFFQGEPSIQMDAGLYTN